MNFFDNGIGFSIIFYFKSHILNNFFEPTAITASESKQKSRESLKSSNGKITWENFENKPNKKKISYDFTL